LRDHRVVFELSVATTSLLEDVVEFPLEQLYGPLLAAHEEILARGELRVKLQRALVVKDTPAVTANVQDENQSFREVTMPRYREMVDTFRSKMWLAEPETREYLGQLIEFVDVWDKILAGKLPRSIAPDINHTEANLKPFYAHLETVHDRPRREVS
jgi:hypothetical protein